MYSAEEIIEKLGLQPHYEGGWYKFVWKSDVTIPETSLPEGMVGDRKSGSLIYYLLQPGEVSCWHVLKSAEIWTYHYGGTLEMTFGGCGDMPIEENKLYIGNHLEQGESFQAIVPSGVWQTTQVVGDTFVLVSCVVTPGFEQDDFYMIQDER